MVNPTLTIVRSSLLSLGLLVAMLAVCLQPVYAVPPPPPPDQGLFTTTSTKGSLPPSDDPAIRQTRLVTINFEQLAGKGQANGAPLKASTSAVKLNLFDQVSLTAVLDRVEANPTGGYTWFGRLQGNELSQVTFVVKDGLMAGNITLPGPFAYQVRYLGNGAHAIAQIAQSLLPAEMDDQVEPPVTSRRPPPPTQMEADDGSIIDVMVAYTPAVRQAVGGTAAIQTLIDLLVAETNTTYQNSGITQRLRLVYTTAVSYTEAGNHSTDLERLQTPADGYLDELHTLRSAYGADLVNLLVNSGGCGLAYVMSPVEPSFEAYAFSVVGRLCTRAGAYSFAHELGHNMGAAHDWYVATGNPPTAAYAYSFGYSNVPGQFRTIMAYPKECADSNVICARVGYWSNPDRRYQGQPVGVPEGSFHAADNRKTLNNTAQTVANFRQSVIAPPPAGPLVYHSHTFDDNNQDQSSGDGDGVANCGETIEVNVGLRNQGSYPVTGVQATLSTNNPDVTLPLNASSPYLNIIESGVVTNSNDFEVALAPTLANGSLIQFTLNISAANGGPWPASFNIPVTCLTRDNYEPDDSPAEARPISSVEPQIHSLVPSGDEDWVTFVLTREAAVRLETSGPNPNANTRMWLYDNQQNLIEYNDDAVNHFSRIERQCGVNALSAGTYLVKVDEFEDDEAIATYNLLFTLIEECAQPGTDLVLWDTSHGIYQDYTLSGRYSALKTDLQSRGYIIEQNEAGLLNLTLSQYSAVVVNLASAWNSPYSAAEATTLETYVNNGGGLIVLGDEPAAPNANLEVIAQRFGIVTGISPLSPTLTNLSTHPIFEDVSTVSLPSAGALNVTSPAEPIAFDEAQNIGIAVATPGAGRVVAVGDMNVWGNGAFISNTTFARNVFNWVTNGGGASASLVYQSRTIDDDSTGQSSGNNDGIVNCGETIELEVALFNQGLSPALGVMGIISATSPYLPQLFTPVSPYPDLAANSSGTNTTPFVFTVASNTPNGHVLEFALQSSAASGGGPWFASFPISVTCNVTPNQPPDSPTNPSPADNLTGVTILADLSWSGGDPDQNDPISYDVYFEADNPTPTTSICGDVSSTSCALGILAPDTVYYWQVIATDSQGATTSGPVWRFTTGSAETIPALTIPASITGYQNIRVAVPINFASRGSQIASTLFSINFDQNCLAFNPADEDDNDIPDAISLNLPPAFTPLINFDANDTGGELDLTLFDASPPLAALPDGRLVTIHFMVTCQAGTNASISFANTPAASFSDTHGQSAPGMTANGSVVIQSGSPGDCNDDQLLNDDDIAAVTAEVFDGDGDDPANTPGGTFPGNPIGCNANQDAVVNAADITCTNLLVTNGPGACQTSADQPATLADDPVLPDLSLPDQFKAPAGSLVTIPITFTANGNAVSAVTFSLDYDETWLSFNPADSNGDGQPDAVTLNLPEAFQTASLVNFDSNDTNGELDFLILDLNSPSAWLPPELRLGSITLQVSSPPGDQLAPLNFALDPPASFSDPEGGDIPGVTTNGSVHITTPKLAISKRSSAANVSADSPITYTLTISNSGTAPATNLVITDTIPAGATYLTGGTKVGPVVSWTMASLAAGGVTQTSFVVAATQTITNSAYRVSVATGYSATGAVPVVTRVGWPIFLPFILK